MTATKSVDFHQKQVHICTDGSTACTGCSLSCPKKDLTRATGSGGRMGKAVLGWICLFAIQQTSTQRGGLELLSAIEIVSKHDHPPRKFLSLEASATVVCS